MYIRSDPLLTVNAKVSEKSMSYEKLWAISLILNLATNPLGLYFILNTHFDPITFLPDRSMLYIYVCWFSKFCSSFFLVSRYHHPWICNVIIAGTVSNGLHVILSRDLTRDLSTSPFTSSPPPLWTLFHTVTSSLQPHLPRTDSAINQH